MSLETNVLVTLNNDASVQLGDKVVATLGRGSDILSPVLKMKPLDSVLANEVNFIISKAVAPLMTARRVLIEENASGQARGILWQITENLGTMPKENIRDFVKNLTDLDKKILAKAGLRIGFNYLFFPQLLKPASQRILALLWKIQNDKTSYLTGFATDGKMSFEPEKGVPKDLYLAQGYILAGKRAIRVDVMERFTAKLREVTRQEKDKAVPLPLDLLSIAGLKRDEAQDVFGFLGFNVEKVDDVLMIRPKFKKTVKKASVTTENIVKDSPFACLAGLESVKK